MRYPKALLELEGEWLVTRLCLALQVHFHPVVVVVGWCGGAVQARVPDGVVVVRAESWWRGSQAESVRTGLLVSPPGPALVQPVDVPLPSDEVFRRLLGSGGPAVPCWRGQRGHPVLLSAADAEGLRAGIPAHGLREVLADAKEIEVDDRSVVWNLNHPRALARWLRQRSPPHHPRREPALSTR